MSTSAGPAVDLVELKDRLRRLSRAERRAFPIESQALALGYEGMRANAPRRSQGYLSRTRTGITSSGEASDRIEEHLAVALFNGGGLMLSGERLALVDYQFPLKSVRGDKGIGKVDLMGLRADGTLAVIELKVEDSREDRRVALLEGLIYAAIVEANISTIAREFRTLRGVEIGLGRPHVIIVAPSGYWSNAALHPDLDAFRTLARATAVAVDTRILLCRLEDADDLVLGLAGQPPRVRGQPFLSPVGE